MMKIKENRLCNLKLRTEITITPIGKMVLIGMITICHYHTSHSDLYLNPIPLIAIDVFIEAWTCFNQLTNKNNDLQLKRAD